MGERGVYVDGNVEGNIHTGDVIIYYLTGTHSTFLQFTVGIENFFTTYLGSPEKPVPFGGRARELAWLDNWLDHGRQPRLLLAWSASAGLNS